MALSKTQEAFLTRVRAVGAGELGVALDDAICSYLVGVIASDLGLQPEFPEFKAPLPEFFGRQPLSELQVKGLDFPPLFERLIALEEDSDAYFYCLATLHKARLKYEKILRAQPISTLEQVGPRGLLQFGSLSPTALTALLLWRKWIYDIDNRAAQETGYVFEPIIAHAIGGVSVGAKNSPVKRKGTGTGRQVDCVREADKRVYEFKLRVTIAASGQGRWGEELEFPEDARKSGYTPVLVVLDSTPNPKLKDLCGAFTKQKGETYVGDDAWKHLEKKAGATMGKFLDKYVLFPLKALLEESPDAPKDLPDLALRMEESRLLMVVGDETLEIGREPDKRLESDADELPTDVANHIPAP
jgi:hypothetical protein